MKVSVGFVGFSGLEITTEIEVEVSGDTLDALLSALESEHGAALLRRLCHEGHTIDSGVMVLRNDVRVDSRNLTQRFNDGDRIAFVRMVAGG